MSNEDGSNEHKSCEAKQHRFVQFMSQGCLNLSQQGLTDKDMPELVQFLLQHPKIKILDLSLNNIGDDGIAYFADRNQNIKQVNFRGNNIGDNGVAVFAYKNQVVELVNFSSNLISDQGVTNFARINETCFHSQFSIKQIH